MPPQPLSSVKPKASVAFGPGALPMRPMLAALVAEVIAFGSEIELQRGRLFGALLESSHEAGMAVYLALTSASARRAALQAAAKTAMSADELELLLRFDKLAGPAQDERNLFAHGLWGFSDDVPGGILLIEPAYRLREAVRFANMFTKLRAGLWNLPIRGVELDYAQIKVYREPDLRRSIRAIEKVYGLAAHLAWLPLQIGDARDRLRKRLSAELPPSKPSTHLGSADAESDPGSPG